jgi:hypothetical protein
MAKYQVTHGIWHWGDPVPPVSDLGPTWARPGSLEKFRGAVRPSGSMVRG